MQFADKQVDLSRPRVMGVLNVTPDSFSDGGSYYRQGRLDVSMACDAALQMVDEGADFIDIGGESTRPGAQSPSLQEEIDRVLPVVEMLAPLSKFVISVDTSRAELMRLAAKSGAGLLNDVRALNEPGALDAAVSTRLPVCLMHMQGQPGDMQENPQYADVVSEVRRFLLARVEACVAAGVDRSQIIVDPGFGFGKTLQHNLQLFGGLDGLAELGLPVLVGVSRKSMIGAVLDKPAEQRLYGGLALAALAVASGASIIRTHDVAATVDAVKMAQAVVSAQSGT